MKQVLNSTTVNDWPNIPIEYNKPVKLYIDGIQGFDPNDKESFHILYIKEAESINPMKNWTIDNYSLFDAIITYDEDVLDKCPNAHFLTFGTSWVHNYSFPEKKFQISHLTGHKEITEGHILRKKIHYKQDKITIPKDFYISKFGGVENFNNNKILGEIKEPLFDSQFHICIENARINNYFSEKVVDCFVSKTVPILFGAPNIGDFFDINGILVVNSLDDIIKACNSLTPETYEKMSESLEKNLTFGKKYANLVGNLEELLKTKILI